MLAWGPGHTGLVLRSPSQIRGELRFGSSPPMRRACHRCSRELRFVEASPTPTACGLQLAETSRRGRAVHSAQRR